MAAVDFALVQLEQNPLAERNWNVGAPVATEKLYVPHTAFGLKPNPAYIDRADEQRGIPGAVPKLLDAYAPSGSYNERCYLDDITWFLYLMGFTPVHTAGGATVTDPDSTTATGVNALNSAIVNVADTSLFPNSGTFIMGGVATAYTGKTATSFTGCGNHAATVGGEVINNNVPAGAHKWVWTKRTGINAQTAQIILNYADESVKLQGNGFAVSDFTFNGDGTTQGNLLGLFMQRLAVDAATVPAYTTQAVPPIRRGDLYVSWLASGGALEDFNFSIANSLNPVRSMSVVPPSSFPDLMEYGDEQVKVTGSIPKRVLAAADIDALLAASTFSAKARWKTPKTIAASGYPYSMWLEMPAAQLTDGTFDDLANKRRFGGSYSFEAAYDETSGFDVRITVVNNTVTVGTSIGLV
jgi:hypothetical protein